MSQMGQNPPPAVRSHVRFHRVQTLAGRVARWSSSQHLVVGDPTLPARLILLLTLRASSIVAQAQPMHSEGTLIILLASRDGLVVASDGRQTVDGVFCDGVSSKLLEPAGHNRLILAVTGRRGFYPATTALASNVCDFIRHTPREFDLGEVVKNYIEGDATFDLPSVDMKKVAEHCIRTLVQYFALNPHRSPAISGDRFESTVVLGSYEPRLWRSVVRTFTIVVRPDGTGLDARLGLNERIGPEDSAEPVAVGEQPYVRQYVLPTISNDPQVSETTRRWFRNFPIVEIPKVSAVSSAEAIQVATDLIDVTAKMTINIPATSGVGGPLDVRLLGEGARPVRLR